LVAEEEEAVVVVPVALLVAAVPAEEMAHLLEMAVPEVAARVVVKAALQVPMV
jgi:hypothetical protein